jgi:hypothetical protein
MTKTTLSAAMLAALGAFALTGGAPALAQSPSGSQAAIHAELGGTYQCKPDPDPCLWPGASPSIAQSGDTLQIKGGNGEISDARLTSDITISAGGTFNSLGIVRPDHTIDWSDGTKWNKQ